MLKYLQAFVNSAFHDPKGVLCLPQCSELRPLFKKGDATEPSNYRPICLDAWLYKLVDSCVAARLATHIDPMLIPEQHGFRPELEVIGATHSLNHIIAARARAKLPTYAIFVDLSKAYDRVPRNLLLAKLQEFGLYPGSAMYHFFEAAFHEPLIHVRVLHELSPKFAQLLGICVS